MPASPIYIYGFHPITAQITNNPQDLIQIFWYENRTDDRLKNLLKTLDKIDISHQKTSKQHLDKLTKNSKHQGIVAQIKLSNLPSENTLNTFVAELKNDALILILDSIQDPRNLGACLRSASAFAVDCVIINKNNSAPINALVHKTSAGALNSLKVFQITNLSRTIKALKQQNIWVIGLDSNTTKSIHQIDFTTKTAIVIGQEDKGLRKLTSQNCDQLAKIPMQGKIASLNLSVATAIALFETQRQRQI